MSTTTVSPTPPPVEAKTPDDLAYAVAHEAWLRSEHRYGLGQHVYEVAILFGTKGAAPDTIGHSYVLVPMDGGFPDFGRHRELQVHRAARIVATQAACAGIPNEALLAGVIRDLVGVARDLFEMASLSVSMSASPAYARATELLQRVDAFGSPAFRRIGEDEHAAMDAMLAAAES